MPVDAQRQPATPHIAFIKFVVGDIDAMMKFYCQALDLTFDRAFENESMIEKILKGPDGALSLILYFYKDQREIVVGDGYGPLGCYVTDVDAAMKQAIDAGASLHREPFSFGEMRVGFVLDPEGRQIEFISDPGRKA